MKNHINSLKTRKASGFTLVELLIVIIIIGILSGMLLLAVGSATDKAEATKVVNALRNYKSAAMMYYMDHNTWPDSSVTNTATSGWTASLDTYVDRSMDNTAFAGIRILDASSGGRALIGLEAAPNAPLANPTVQAKLAGQAQSSALFEGIGTIYTGGNTIYMPLN